MGAERAAVLRNITQRSCGVRRGDRLTPSRRGGLVRFLRSQGTLGRAVAGRGGERVVAGGRGVTERRVATGGWVVTESLGGRGGTRRSRGAPARRPSSPDGRTHLPRRRRPRPRPRRPASGPSPAAQPPKPPPRPRRDRCGRGGPGPDHGHSCRHRSSRAARTPRATGSARAGPASSLWRRLELGPGAPPRPIPFGPTRLRSAPPGPARPGAPPRSSSLGPTRPRSAPLGPARPPSAPLGPARPPSAPLGPARPRSALLG